MDRVWTIALIAIVLPILGALLFRRVGQDYERRGRLTRFSTFLQVLIFFLHGASSYVLLDSRLGAIDAKSPIFGLAVVLLAGGLVMLFAAMGRLGVPETLGRDVTGLHCSGMYQHSRNPQILSYGLVVTGYALLWPSWSGVLWLTIYAVIAHMMIRTEEAHLRKTYGDSYVEYCTRTPRYIDLPGKGRD
jgi:protein-S-isoprenylcysteine O-methyltransferase Ste14